MEDLQERLEAAKRLLNENDYVVIPVEKAQMCLCETCREPDDKKCRYNAVGYTCSSLLCINQYIREQISYQEKIKPILGEE